MEHEIHKLTKEGNIIWPATTTSAIVDPGTSTVIQDNLNSWNISKLWPDSTVQTIDAAVPFIDSKINVERKVQGCKVEFVNSTGKNEIWEFVGGTGVAFTSISGWREIGGNIISELINKVLPITVTLTASTTVIPIGEATNVTYSWTAVRNGVNIAPDCTIVFDGVTLTTSNTTISFTPSSNTSYSKKLTVSYRGDVVEKSINVVAIQPTYAGYIAANAAVNDTTIKALSQNLQDTKARTISGINYTNSKYCYAFPAVLGSLSSIKDSNGFEYLTGDGFTSTSLNINSVSYNVYYMPSPATVTNFKYIFA